MKINDIEYEYAWTCQKCKCHVYEKESNSVTEFGFLKICASCKVISE